MRLTRCPFPHTMPPMIESEKQIAPGALGGVRVLEMGTLIAGPFATRIMADLGAEVMKIEPPGKGDPMREWGAGMDMGADNDAGSLWFAVQSRNKRSVTVDLRAVEGQRLVRRLAETCDVVVENFRPGALERWNLGWEQLRAVNPRLVMVRVSGFGQTGPYRSRPGFGNIAEAMSGLRYITGDADGPPMRVGMSLADHVAALYAVIGALSALHAREVTGHGQMVDVSLLESMFSFLQDAVPRYAATGEIQERTGNDLGFAAPSNVYETADGVWMAISGNADSIFLRLMRAIGRADLAADPALWDNPGRVAQKERIDAAISAWTRAQPAADVTQTLEAAEVPYGPVYNIADIFADAQYQARDMVLTLPHPAFGTVAMPGIVPALSETPGAVRWPGPAARRGYGGGVARGRVRGGRDRAAARRGGDLRWRRRRDAATTATDCDLARQCHARL